jgi:Flp pilus assembly protein CpaB
MQKRTGRRLIFAGLLLLILVSALALFFRLSLPREQAAPIQPEYVFVAAASKEIVANEVITADMLQTMLLPPVRIPVDALYDPSLLIGKRAVVDIEEGTVIVSAMLAPSGSALITPAAEGQGLIENGKVAVPLMVSSLSGVSSSLRPGDHVDIIGVFLFVDLDSNSQTQLPLDTEVLVRNSQTGAIEFVPAGEMGRAADSGLGVPIYVYPSEDQRPRLITQLIIENASIFSITQTDSSQSAVMVVVSPLDAQAIQFMQINNARLVLALRGFGDDTIHRTTAIDLSVLLMQYGISLPDKLPIGIYSPTFNHATPTPPRLPPKD